MEEGRGSQPCRRPWQPIGEGQCHPEQGLLPPRESRHQTLNQVSHGKFQRRIEASGRTVFDNYLVKYGDDELLESGGGGVVDDGIFARLQDEADIQGGNQQLALDVDGIVGQQRRECLEDLELNV